MKAAGNDADFSELSLKEGVMVDMEVLKKKPLITVCLLLSGTNVDIWHRTFLSFITKQTSFHIAEVKPIFRVAVSV